VISKLLIANRGEIACRVIRTARRLGIRSVAVFSDADAGAPHVAMADEAVCVGPEPAADSYLKAAAILEAARRTGADAVHPGYGFLSENAAFAQACLDAGLVFVGPPPSAITAMGDKARAKRRMIDAGVPCVPGYLGDEQGDDRLAAQARRLGFPLLVKAVAGGGGRGMRLVRSEADLTEAIAGARREATSAFGDGTLMLERLVEGGRHIEVQVFADAHGHAIHFGERDCSTQRRRQKVIEEAPSPVIDAARRASMGADAVAAARAVGYVGAGTVEFIVDADGQHWFLEMNTRLQVEHPVTEAITGLDLVEWQLRVADGEALPLTQDQVRFDGHAIEVRLYAEDPYAGFAPQTGTVQWWRPERCDTVRIDHGITEGQTITPYYDAMVAKLIAHGRDRADAIRRLRAALADTPLFGLKHNARFLADLLGHEAFRAATITTATLDDWVAQGAPILQRPEPDDAAWAIAAAAMAWAGGNGWRSDSVRAFDLTLECEGSRRTQRVGSPGGVRILGWHDGELRFEQGGVRRRATALRRGGTLHLAWQGATFVFSEPSAAPAATSRTDPARAHAPVAGVVAKVAVAAGDAVEAGQPLVCVETMKMEMWVAAGTAGVVAELRVAAGDSVAAGALLVRLEGV
jgi:geranyl-CoA carboxylase alpha subunit